MLNPVSGVSARDRIVALSVLLGSGSELLGTTHAVQRALACAHSGEKTARPRETVHRENLWSKAAATRPSTRVPLERGRDAMPDDDFDRAVETYRQALGALLTGDPSHVADLFSRRDDVTLANPLGPPRRGRADVEKAITEAAAHFTDGSVRCEEVSRYSTPELGYVVQLERAELQLAGQDDMSASTLRVTMIFRREGDAWRVAHRHADPITTPQPINTVLDT
jgi:uncharacterized protein (TIGR02246 family)